MRADLIEEMLADACARRSVPGAAVGLQRGDERIVLTFGSVTSDRDEPVERTTPFHLGSIAKSLAGAVLLDAARRGELGLDVPCSEQAAGAWDDTPLELMAQTTGRPNLLPDDGEDLAGFVARVAAMPRVHAPGRFSYCNAGWSVLDLVLRERCGASFEELAVDRFLGPGATFGSPPGGAAGHAVDADGGLVRVPPDYADAASAAGSRWWATADQALDHALFHLRGGDAPSVLEPADLALLREPRVPIPGATAADAWGLGWAVWDRGEHRSFGWAGYTGGHRAFLRCYPDQDAAFVVLANSAGPLFRAPGGSALFDDLLPAILEALRVPPLGAAARTDVPAPVQELAGSFGPVVLETAGVDGLVMHAEALGEPVPLPLVRLGGNAFAPPGEPPGSMAIAVDDDLLYLGPMAVPRN